MTKEEAALHDLARLLDDSEDWTVSKVLKLVETGVITPREARKLLGLDAPDQDAT